jgi:GTP-binding protein LepA
MNQDKIRNFCIIAHINHGKSTLADRFLELTKTVPVNKLREQFLDSNPIERERGITIKLAPVRMNYEKGGKNFVLNLIDTPGHVDFSYEVSRSLAACEGAVLLIDATEGIQAQTVSNFWLAKGEGLKILPVINKIDIDGAQPEKTARELRETFGFLENEALFCSAKTGVGVKEVLEKVVSDVPPPGGNSDALFRALVFNSFFHPYKGIVASVRVVDGEHEVGTPLWFMASGVRAKACEVGFFTPELKSQKRLRAGEVGYIATGLKELTGCRVGDTIVEEKASVVSSSLLPGYKEPKPMVFFSFYPQENKNFFLLREALGKLKLNDASLNFTTESSPLLGKGFRVGFLGVLHAEVTEERLEREFGIELVVVNPNVQYQILKTNGEEILVESIICLPPRNQIKEIREPIFEVKIFCPEGEIDKIVKLCQARRGLIMDIKPVTGEAKTNQLILIAHLPLVELISNFYDELKSLSHGFASLDYEFLRFEAVDLLLVEILLNGKKVESLSFLCLKRVALRKARSFVEKLKGVIPRQQFEVVIQAAVGNKIMARGVIKPFRKDVTQKLYGGDQTRKDKLLKKQKRGKKRLKMVGGINLPQEAFMIVLKIN